MSTPQAKRRRLNEAAKTLQKPFKSHPPDISTPSAASIYTAEFTPTGNNEQRPRQTVTPHQLSVAPSLPKSHASKSLVSRPSFSKLSHGAVKKSSSKPSLAREIMQLRNEIQMLTQAQSLATSSQDEDLVILIDKWRTASRAAAEELFGSTRDRVNRMGGVGAWMEREREAKERQKKWDQEELDAQREKLEEAKENGEISEEAFDEYSGVEETKVEDEKETFKGASDDSFTMDMMLKTLNIDLDLIGYNKEAQRWDG
ncbi:hypothetical protein IQ07DRAFT_609346 [Pyrenochaeta sp. DS3sAY3a]|nr:hypothetical protein IQ07DRAFT_609346 [Pyrenochaeta sp. DS3sAY3a]